jgi:hypothetical protein
LVGAGVEVGDVVEREVPPADVGAFVVGPAVPPDVGALVVRAAFPPDVGALVVGPGVVELTGDLVDGGEVGDEVPDKFAAVDCGTVFLAQSGQPTASALEHPSPRPVGGCE